MRTSSPCPCRDCAGLSRRDFLQAGTLGLGGIALALAAPGTAAAQGQAAHDNDGLIILKDGTILEGKVTRDHALEVDPYSHEPILIPKTFFYVDDKARRLYFSPTQVRDVHKKDPPIEEQFPWKVNKYIVMPKKLPAFLGFLRADKWNDKWERDLYFQGPNGQVQVHQHIGLLSPSWVRADCTERYLWSCAYLTRELGEEMVKQLLATHPDLQPKKGATEEQKIAARLRYCNFFLQAGWFGEAEAGLDRLVEEMPAQKERVEAARKTLASVRARESFEGIKRLHLAGQYRTVAKRLEAFPEKDAPEQTLADLKALKSETEQAAEKVADASRHLDELAAKVKGTPEAVLGEAATLIRADVHPDNVHRLETFLGQARQAESQRKQDRTVDLSPAQLLSYAVSGWLLGNPASEPRPETALRLWRARHMVMEYLKTDDTNIRNRVLSNYLKELANYLKDQGEVGLLNEMAHLVQQLPPPEAVPDPDPAKALELKTGGRRRATTYHVRVPPEYRHSRPYPLLIVLHDAGEKATAMLNRWTEAAAEQGFLVAAPEWEQYPNATYNFTDEEHAVVLTMLRDLRRRFQVDSDRVFLTGLGQGGGMAYDVGMSHPDLFAGVLPMSAGPKYFSVHYWRNAQYLPYYVVSGDRAGDDIYQKIRDQFKEWVQRGFPSLWVQYKGRGAEWFGGDVPLMFDWMRNKRRIFPLHQLGTESNGGPVGTEFQTMRAGDNRFYWLSTDAINEACLNSVARWRVNVTPATLTARIDPTTNEVSVRATGLKQLTVWFGRDVKGTPMIDFDKPVLIRVGLETKHNNKVSPSLATMLEDLYQRGDRQRLFLAKVSLDLRR
jgi:hypothetical protein